MVQESQEPPTMLVWSAWTVPPRCMTADDQRRDQPLQKFLAAQLEAAPKALGTLPHGLQRRSQLRQKAAAARRASADEQHISPLAGEPRLTSREAATQPRSAAWTPAPPNEGMLNRAHS